MAFCAYGGMITIGNVVRYAGAVQQFIQGMTDLFVGWSRLHHDRMQMDEYLEYMGLQNKMKRHRVLLVWRIWKIQKLSL